MGSPLKRPVLGDGPPHDVIDAIGRTSSLLLEALEIADSNNLSPEIGARLDELIERLGQELVDRKFARAMVAAWDISDE
jgi:hypothetical protein